MVLRVRSTPTRFPTNILSTPVDSTPLHSIPSVWCPRGSWLCSPPWHACVHVPWAIGQEFTVRAGHLLCVHFWFVRSFFIAAVTFIVFWKQTLKCKKCKDHCEMATVSIKQCEKVNLFKPNTPKGQNTVLYPTPRIVPLSGWTGPGFISGHHCIS